jgi:Ca2+/H+ antiporter
VSSNSTPMIESCSRVSVARLRIPVLVSIVKASQLPRVLTDINILSVVSTLFLLSTCDGIDRPACEMPRYSRELG